MNGHFMSNAYDQLLNSMFHKAIAVKDAKVMNGHFMANNASANDQLYDKIFHFHEAIAEVNDEQFTERFI
jgi:hypothetical protein